MTAVWRYSQAPDMGSLLILLALADWCDEDGYCFPSRRAIGYKTGASVATVKRALRGHMDREELERVEMNGHLAPGPREFIGRTGFHPTNLYRLKLIDKLGSKRPESLARNSGRTGVSQTPVAGPNGGHGDPLTGVSQTPQLGSPVSVSLCTDTKEDTSDDTSVQSDTSDQEHRQGAARARNPHEENPAANVGVLTRLAHEVLDLLAEARDVQYAEVLEAVKRHAAVSHIAYNTEVITRAIDSAVYQRRRAGKPSVIPGLSGDAAFRLESGSG